jgi:DNA modification methylase
MKTNIIHLGSALEKLKELPSNSIDLVCTSPPYWQLRDYGYSNQLGMEPTPQEYISNLCDIFDECFRILKPTGSCYVNLGDTYNGTKNGNTETIKNPRCVTDTFHKPKLSSIPYKSLVQIPSLFSLEMVNRGWCLRNKICWFKSNAMPHPVEDRFAVDFEEIFFFTKQPCDYYFDVQMDGTHRMRTVWNIPTKPYPEAHFATFPPDMITPIIRSSCPEHTCTNCGKPKLKQYEVTKKGSAKDTTAYMESIGSSLSHAHTRERGSITPDKRKFIGYIPQCTCNAPFTPGLVLDPFFGSGTTGLVALQNNRHFIGIELKPEYAKLATDRLLPLIQTQRLTAYI